MADSLGVVVSNFKPPQNPFLRYEVEVRYMPSIPNNVKYSKVFEDEEQNQTLHGDYWIFFKLSD